MTKTQTLEQIEKEFATAKHAQEIGNDGMVRVCARRAAGVAIGYWLERNPRASWGMDAMNRLKNLQRDAMIPIDVRDAAARLTTKITEQFTSPFPTDPIHDSKIIINHLLL
jgi:hypothetical protein